MKPSVAASATALAVGAIASSPMSTPSPTTPSELSTDKTRTLSPYPYLAGFTMPVAILLGWLLGGAFNFFVPLFAFIVVPLLELALPIDGYNPSKQESKALEQCLAFRIITWLWVPVQMALVLGGAYALSFANYSWIEWIGLTLSVGIVSGGLGITISHELMHKQNRLEQTFAKIILLFVCYMHFFIEHIWGHHKNVSTPNDPATSRFKESLYEFIPRSVVGSYMSAWHIEASRLDRLGVALWSYHNQMLWFAALPAMLAVFIQCMFGTAALVFFLMQSVIAFSMLEWVNYIEHYGLQRRPSKVNTNGNSFERVSPLHSWNADHRVTNYFLFKLQRHADHHTWPTRRYQTLRSFRFAPQLPTGYLGMMVLALVPRLWRRVMDPRVIAYNLIVLCDWENTSDGHLMNAIDSNEPQNSNPSNLERQLIELQQQYPPMDVVRLVEWALLIVSHVLACVGSFVEYLGERLGARGPAHLLVRLGWHVAEMANRMVHPYKRLLLGN